MLKVFKNRIYIYKKLKEKGEKESSYLIEGLLIISAGTFGFLYLLHAMF